MQTWLIIAALGLAVAVTCFFYMQLARSSPKQAILGSVAGTLVGFVALGIALVR